MATDQPTGVKIPNEAVSLLPTTTKSLIVGDSDCDFNEIIDILNPSGSLELNKGWSSVARALCTKEETIHRERTALLMETKQITEVYVDILIEWRGLKGSEATLHSLEKILRNNGFAEASEGIRVKYCELFAPVTYQVERKEQIRSLDFRYLALITGVTILAVMIVAAVVYIVIEEELSPPMYRKLLPNLPDVYISRQLKIRGEISGDTLFSTDIGDNVLVLWGMTQFEARNFTRKGWSVSQMFNTLKQKAVIDRYITDVNDITVQFPQLCNLASKTNLSVHLIEYQIACNTFKWRESCGLNMSLIQNGVDFTETTIPEGYFSSLPFFKNNNTVFSLNRQAVVISGPTGIGKSTLLTKIATEIQGNKTFVISTSVTNFMNSALEYGSVVDTEALLKAIAKIACNNAKCTTLLPYEIQHGWMKLVLLLDGFDQLPFEMVQNGTKALKHIRNNWNSTLLFVTTQPIHDELLETSLNSLVYRLEPLSASEQNNYLFKRWSKASDNVNPERLKNYAETCVKEINSRLSDNELQFSGNALLTYFVAETYSEQALDYSNSVNKHVNDQTLSEYMTPVYDTYNRFVLHRLTNFAKDDDTYEQLDVFHQHQALHIMFPEELTPTDFPPNLEEILTIGIMEMDNERKGKLKFIHPTLIDYFISRFAANCNINDNLCSNIIDKILAVKNIRKYYACNDTSIFKFTTYTFSKNLVTYFLNASPSLANIAERIAVLHNKKDVLISVAHDGYTAILEAYFNSNNVSTDIYEELILHAVIHSSDDMVVKLATAINSATSTAVSNIKLVGYKCPSLSLLHLAAMRGKYDIFDYLLQYFEIKYFRDYLVHAVVLKPFDKKAIHDKIAILENLVKLLGYNSLDISYPENFRFAPICNAFQKELILKLIDLGAQADWRTVCSHGMSILQNLVTRRGISPDEFHEIMEKLNQRHQLSAELINFKNNTALKSYIRRYEPKNETLQLFQKFNADFECRVEEESDGVAATLFSLAIMTGKTPTSLEVLMEYTPYWQTCNFQNDSALTVAIEYYHYSAARLFISINPDLVNFRDAQGFTPLYSLITPNILRKKLMVDNAFKSKWSRIEMINLFVENRTDRESIMNAENGKDRVTPFLSAVKTQDIEIVRHLVLMGALTDIKDVNNNTALHYALSPDIIDDSQNRDVISRYLIEVAKIEVNARNAQNFTALEQYIEYAFYIIISPETIQLMVRYDAITSTDLGNRILEKLFQCLAVPSEDLNYFRVTVSCIRRAGEKKGFKLLGDQTLRQTAVENKCDVGINYLSEVG